MVGMQTTRRSEHSQQPSAPAPVDDLEADGLAPAGPAMSADPVDATGGSGAPDTDLEDGYVPL